MGIAALRYTVFVDILTVVFLVREFFGLKNVRMSIYLINGCLVWSGFFQLLCLPLSVPSLCTLVYINSTSIIFEVPWLLLVRGEKILLAKRNWNANSNNFSGCLHSKLTGQPTTTMIDIQSS